MCYSVSLSCWQIFSLKGGKYNCKCLTVFHYLADRYLLVEEGRIITEVLKCFTVLLTDIFAMRRPVRVRLCVRLAMSLLKLRWHLNLAWGNNKKRKKRRIKRELLLRNLVKWHNYPNSAQLNKIWNEYYSLLSKHISTLSFNKFINSKHQLISISPCLNCFWVCLCVTCQYLIMFR